MCYQIRNFTEGYQEAHKSHGLPWDTTRPDNGHCVTGSTRNIKMLIDGLCESISNILSIIAIDTVLVYLQHCIKFYSNISTISPSGDGSEFFGGLGDRVRKHSYPHLLPVPDSVQYTRHRAVGHLASTYTQLLVWWWLRGRGVPVGETDLGDTVVQY